ncbi:MAG: hypothetical protein JWQ22_1891 [Devosia sp.]|nr:hypothetical protein [Devosia sp.]
MKAENAHQRDDVVTGLELGLRADDEGRAGAVKDQATIGSAGPVQARKTLSCLASKLPKDRLLLFSKDTDPQLFALVSTCHVDEVRAILSDTSGGSSDTEVKELTSMPTGSPSTSAASSTTPVGKADVAERIACGTGSTNLVELGSAGPSCVQIAFILWDSGQIWIKSMHSDGGAAGSDLSRYEQGDHQGGSNKQATHEERLLSAVRQSRTRGFAASQIRGTCDR